MHLKNEVCKDDGPRKGPQAKGGRRGVLGLSGVGASSFGFVGKLAEKTEKGWDASGSFGSIVWEFEKGHAARDSV